MKVELYWSTVSTHGFHTESNSDQMPIDWFVMRVRWIFLWGSNLEGWDKKERALEWGCEGWWGCEREGCWPRRGHRAAQCWPSRAHPEIWRKEAGKRRPILSNISSSLLAFSWLVAQFDGQRYQLSARRPLTFLPDKQLWPIYVKLFASLITKVAFSEHQILTKRHAQSCSSASHVFHCQMPSAIEWGKNTVRSRWWWCVCAPGPWVPVRPRGPPMSQDPSYCLGHKYIGYKYTKMY